MSVANSGEERALLGAPDQPNNCTQQAQQATRDRDVDCGDHVGLATQALLAVARILDLAWIHREQLELRSIG